MGCSVCLDDFDQADGDARRATALTCGHIFHYDCLQTWFYGSAAAARHIHSKRCPLCATVCSAEHMVRLFPSDADELSTYLSGQHLHELVRINAQGQPDHSDLTPPTTVAHQQLLNNLIDFNKTVQQYAMAVHSVRLEIVLKSGVKLRRLFHDLTRDACRESSQAIVQALDALEGAVHRLAAIEKDYTRRAKRSHAAEAEWKDKTAKLVDQLVATDHAKINAQIKLVEADGRMREANDMVKRATEQEKLNHTHRDEIAAQRIHLRKREHELQKQQNKTLLDANVRINSMRQQTDSELAQMRRELEQARTKATDAERERALAHQKSCMLADQLRQAQRQAHRRNQVAPEAAAAATSRTGEGAASREQKRIRALEARLHAMTSQLEAAGIATPEQRLARAPASTRRDAIDLCSSSPAPEAEDDLPTTPRDGYEPASQPALSPAARGVSPGARRRGKWRARASLSVEPEQLDDEMDDALFPMPGLVRPRARPPVRPPLALNPPSANMSDDAHDDVPAEPAVRRSAGGLAMRISPAPAAGGGAEASASGRFGGRIRSPGVKRRRTEADDAYGFLHRRVGVKLGPKHRPKH